MQLTGSFHDEFLHPTIGVRAALDLIPTVEMRCVKWAYRERFSGLSESLVTQGIENFVILSTVALPFRGVTWKSLDATRLKAPAWVFTLEYRLATKRPLVIDSPGSNC
jgi:hypothetical protein